MSELYGNRVQSTTDIELMPLVVDTILEGNNVFGRIVRAAKKWKGRTLQIPIKTAKNSTGGSFSGDDLLDTSSTDNRVKLEFTPSWFSKTSKVLMDEQAVNEASSEQQVLDLVALTLQSDAQDAADDLGTQFYGSNASTTKNFLGLADHVDDGSTVATYGGLSRSTYSGLQSTVTASGGTLTLAKMDTLWNAVATSGSIAPSIIVSTPTVQSLYEQLVRPQERVYKPVSKVKNLSLGTGADQKAITYRGVEFVADDKCTSGALLMLNEAFIDFYALTPPKQYRANAVQYRSKIEGNDYSDVDGLGFSHTPWRIPTNQMAMLSYTLFGGQFVCRNPKRQGKLTSVTGI